MRIRRQMRRAAGRFGEAVKLYELRLEAVLRLAQHIFRNGRGAIEKLAHGGDVHLGDIGLLQQEENDGRHDEKDGDAFLLDQMQDQRRIHILQHDILAAMQMAQNADIDARHMEERHADEHDIALFPIRPAGLHALVENGEIVAVGELHALGVARRAGGVELDDIVIDVGGQHRVFVREAVAPLVEGNPVRPPAVQRHHFPDIRAFRKHLLDHVVIFRADEKNFRAGIVQHIGDFRRGETPVDADHHGIRLEGAVEHLEIEIGTLADIADAAVGPAAFRDQPLRHAIGIGVELGIGGAAFAEDLGRLVAFGLGPVARDIRNAANLVRIEHGVPPLARRPRPFSGGICQRGDVIL